MDRPLLNDPGQNPDDDVLARYLTKAKGAWDEFSARLEAEFDGVTLVWRYYSDGKAWLCRVMRRKKTICWVSVWEGCFRVVFYFTQKHDEGIEALDISQSLKDSFRAHEPIGKLKPMIIEVKSKKALNDVFPLVAFKISLK